jgi:hypothetical protein
MKKRTARLAAARERCEKWRRLEGRAMAILGPSVSYARGQVSQRLSRARSLAGEIELLLAGLSPDEIASYAYQVRLAEGLTRSLIDQLEELERGPSSSRKIPVCPGSGVVESEPDTTPGMRSGYGVRSMPGR